MSRSMKVVMWICGVATVVVAVGIPYVQYVTPRVDGWGATPENAAAHFGALTFGLAFIPVIMLACLVMLIGWPTLAILTVLHCLRPGPRATVWERLETAKILDQIELERQWEELEAGGALEKIRHDRARINPPGGGLTFPPRN